MLPQRLSVLLPTVLAVAVTAPPSHACCLTDWLFGRTATPYVAGYAPVGQPYVAGYAPLGQPYVAGYAPVTTAYAANYPTYAAPQVSIANTTAAAGAFQVQRPAYYDNPSVYTGLPVGTGAIAPTTVYSSGAMQTSYNVPLTDTLRNNGASGAYLGSANQYPSYQATTAPVVSGYSAGNATYQSAYPSVSSPGLPITTTTPTGVPTTALPATPVQPLFAPVPQRRVGGLARFFGALFGTNYTSSYYRAPVTYYRPVTSVDPVSGTTVTVQQPCTSYVQQLQRVPYSSLQVGQPTSVQPTTVAPATDCPQPQLYGATPYAPSTQYAPGTQYQPSTQYAPGTQYQPSTQYGIGQVSGTDSAPGSYAAPIPSTAPSTSGGYNVQPSYAPNTLPLTGSQGGNTGNDLAPVDQPQLNAAPPSESQYRQQTSPPSAPSTDDDNQSPRSYWELQDASNSTALIPRDPASLSAPSFTGVQPIRAPEEDNVAPLPTQRPAVQPPSLPPSRSASAPTATSVSLRTATPTAAPVAAATPVAATPRDNSWAPIRRP